MNTIGGFKCKCTPQWMGDLCDEGRFSSHMLSVLNESRNLSHVRLKIKPFFERQINNCSGYVFLFSCRHLVVIRLVTHSGGSWGTVWSNVHPKPLWRLGEYRPFNINVHFFGDYRSRNRIKKYSKESNKLNNAFTYLNFRINVMEFYPVSIIE